jgi:CheY-like chemotaxis protein
MSRPRVLLVDPDDTRREVFQAYLASRFDVVAMPVAAKAQARFAGLNPDAVLAHARQPGSSGLRMCKELRALEHGQDCLMVVYGHMVGPRRTPAQCEAMRAESQVDVWMQREVDEIDLEKVLGVKLLAPVEVPAVKAPDIQKIQFVSAHREEPCEDERTWGRLEEREPDRKSFLATMREQYGGLIDKLPKDQDVSWGQLMRARANLHNISVLLDKPVTPLIQRLPEDRPLTAAEILRARVTLENFRIILRRRLPGESAER